MATRRAFGGVSDSPLGGFLSGLGEGGGENVANLIRQKHEEAMKAADFLRNIQLQLLSNPEASGQAAAIGAPGGVVSAAEAQAAKARQDKIDAEQRALRAKLLEQPIPETTSVGAGGETVTTRALRNPENPSQTIPFVSTGPTNVQAGQKAGAIKGAEAEAELPGELKKIGSRADAAKELQKLQDIAAMERTRVEQSGANARSAATQAGEDRRLKSTQDFQERIKREYSSDVTPEQARELDASAKDTLKGAGLFDRLHDFFTGDEDSYQKAYEAARVRMGLPAKPKLIGQPGGGQQQTVVKDGKTYYLWPDGNYHTRKP